MLGPRAPEHGLNAWATCTHVAQSQLDMRPAYRNWQRLASTVQSAFDVFRTRTIYSHMIAKADYGAVGLKYKVLTDVLYRRDYFECQGISPRTKG